MKTKRRRRRKKKARKKRKTSSLRQLRRRLPRHQPPIPLQHQPHLPLSHLLLHPPLLHRLPLPHLPPPPPLLHRLPQFLPKLHRVHARRRSPLALSLPCLRSRRQLKPLLFLPPEEDQLMSRWTWIWTMKRRLMPPSSLHARRHFPMSLPLSTKRVG